MIISVDDIIEQLPRDGVCTLRDHVAQVPEIVSKAAPVEANGPPFTIAHDTRSNMLVVSIPGVLDPLASKLDEAPRTFNEDEARRVLAPIVAAFKAQGEPYALDAWPNEDELL